MSDNDDGRKTPVPPPPKPPRLSKPPPPRSMTVALSPAEEKQLIVLRTFFGVGDNTDIVRQLIKIGMRLATIREQGKTVLVITPGRMFRTDALLNVLDVEEFRLV